MGNRLIIASPHRYPDLARLWYRVVSGRLKPACERAGLQVEVVIFRDTRPDTFRPEHYPDATLDSPRPGARDFVEFYDAALAYGADFVFFIDADVFVLDGDWVASYLPALDDPGIAAVSFLQRASLPGVYALLCKAADFRILAPPALAATYENLNNWPHALNRGPGENASIALLTMGKRIVNAQEHNNNKIADFHGTTVIRASREMFGSEIGEKEFEALVSRKRYFMMGAYDNVLLANVYERIFKEAFAPGDQGESLGSSFTIPNLRRVLESVDSVEKRSRLAEYFERSNRAILRLALSENMDYVFPDVLPPAWLHTTAP
ncbi:MAG: hypothetical protein ABSH09_29470 [Bryobacteraceae bacterium]|jgi:hypothetical protein